MHLICEKITCTFHLMDMCSPVSDYTVRWLFHVCSDGQLYHPIKLFVSTRLVLLHFSTHTIGHGATDCKHGSLLTGEFRYAFFKRRR